MPNPIGWHQSAPNLHLITQDYYRAANAEKVKASCAAWRQKNPEKALAASAAWKKSNPEKVKSGVAAYRAAYPERVKSSVNKWQKANLESRRINEQNYRSRKSKNGGKLSQGLAAKLFKLQRGKCPCCQKPLGSNYHLDHIVPLKLGGANEDWNVQLLRQQCNSQKRAKHPIDFMQSRGFLL